MEITGNIVSVNENNIRIRTVKKKQEIDIFFPESKKVALHYRFEPHMISKMIVEPETIEIEGNKYAKLWFKYVTMPDNMKLEDCRPEAAKRVREIMKILYQPGTIFE
jgi:hypothetical protein